MSEEANQDVRLAEFASLRQEVGQRTTIQQGLIALNLTVAGTISGLVVAGTGREKLLLVVAFASSIFGLLWLDHHLNIHQIAEYIKDKLWSWDPSWENHIRERPKPRWWRATYLIVTILSFVGVSAVALVIAASDIAGNSGLTVLWWLGVVLAAVTGFAFLVVFFQGQARLK